MESIFTVLSKYPTSIQLSPFENFSTEALVFILKYSQSTGSSLLRSFLERLNCVKEKYEYIDISTQKSFDTVKGYNPKPDISIVINNPVYEKPVIYLIEVKIGSELNQYSINSKKEINQIELYQSIKGVNKDNVFLLSKVLLDSRVITKKNNILWCEIAMLFKKESHNSEVIERFLMENFIKFLEDNNMSISKIKTSLDPGFTSLNSIISNLVILFDNLGISYKEYTYASYGYYGFNIVEKRDGYMWLGIYAMYPDKICLEVMDSKLEDKAIKGNQFFQKVDFGKFGEKVVSMFEMDPVFFTCDEVTQYNKIVEWLSSCLRHLNVLKV